MALLETFSDFTSQRFYFVMERLGVMGSDMVQSCEPIPQPAAAAFLPYHSVCHLRLFDGFFIEIQFYLG